MKKSILTILVMAVLPSFVFAAEPEIVVTAPRPQKNDKAVMMKLTSNYIVRNLNGEQVCNLAKGSMVAVTAVAPDAERVQIMVPNGPCAGVVNGFVYINYLRPVTQSVDKFTETALVELNGLSLRKEPSVEDGTFSCSLPKNAKVNIVNEVQKRNRWVEIEIENPPAGCPTKGWVVASYLKPDLDLKTLPKASGKVLTEARTPVDCTECVQGETSGGKVSAASKTAKNAQEIERFVNAPQGAQIPSPFTAFAKELQRSRKCPPAKQSEYKCNRGLMQMPTDGNAGFCGTHHYTPDRPPGVDTYAAPHTACSLAAVAQEWKKTVCPNDNAGCRIAWGDISHSNRPLFNGHKEHTSGECIDIRPFNKGSFRDAGRKVGSGDYDRETTVAFLKLAKKFGGDIRYSDRKISNEHRDLGIAWGGSAHNNHMHICFEASNSTVKNACNNLNVDPAVCSELQ
ncbi:MAG: SH3 domain-containing protein [Pseudobdellovibrio sp.]|nr:SH3 domain-containing protein [Pseudobdellovibrio sp.]